MEATEIDRIWDIVNGDLSLVYAKLSEHKALNLALYRMVDDAVDRGTDRKVRKAIDNAISLLTIQEELFLSLEKIMDSVMNKLTDLAVDSNKGTEWDTQHTAE